MCGIVGVASFLDINKRNWIQKAIKTLVHRGPDFTGEWWSKDNKVGFAHSRLSIIDLSLSANQPMHLINKGLSIVYNGEIYNYKNLRKKLEKLGHKFETKSDTEVILLSYVEWGVDCINYFNGMFAFSIYDSSQKKLFIARDRAGQKPIFYHYENDTIYFSSELKALFENSSLKKKIDIDSLDCYFAMGFVPRDRSILLNFKKLPPAHALVFDIKAKKLNIWNYWKIPQFENISENFNQNFLVDKLDNIMNESVKKHLVADVDVGVLLSGGLDSSLITAYASNNFEKLKTFNVSFPGFGKFDESENAKFIASHFQTDHTELIVDKNTKISDLLIKLSFQYDEPIVDSSIFPTYLISNLISKYCKVALGGDGGDELFGGYDHYQHLMKRKIFLQYFPTSFIKNLSMLSKVLPIGMKGHNFFESMRFDLNKSVPYTVSIFSQNIRQKLLKKFENYKNVAEEIYQEKMIFNKDLIQRATRMDFENYLPEDILVKVDRASMLNSLEIRSPMLDCNVIDFAFRSIPSVFKVSANEKKIILKKLASKVLPNNFNKDRKQGFSIPLDYWLKKGELRDLFWDTLTSENCAFDKKSILNILKGQDQGRSNSERLLSLVQFELWKKNHKISL